MDPEMIKASVERFMLAVHAAMAARKDETQQGDAEPPKSEERTTDAQNNQEKEEQVEAEESAVKGRMKRLRDMVKEFDEDTVLSFVLAATLDKPQDKDKLQSIMRTGKERMLRFAETKKALREVLEVKSVPSTEGRRRDPRQKCQACGGPHSRRRCRFQKAKCYNCRSRGHIQSVCRKPRRGAKREQHAVGQGEAVFRIREQTSRQTTFVHPEAKENLLKAPAITAFNEEEEREYRAAERVLKCPEATRKLERLHVDLAGTVKGRNLFVAVDAFSQFPFVYALPASSTTSVIEAMSTFCQVFGKPELIAADKGMDGRNEELQRFCASHHIELRQTQQEGIADRYLRCTRTYLRKNREAKLKEAIGVVLIQSRNSPNAKNKDRMTPADVFFGRPIRSASDLLKRRKSRFTVEEKKEENEMRTSDVIEETPPRPQFQLTRNEPNLEGSTALAELSLPLPDPASPEVPDVPKPPWNQMTPKRPRRSRRSLVSIPRYKETRGQLFL